MIYSAQPKPHRTATDLASLRLHSPPANEERFENLAPGAAAPELDASPNDLTDGQFDSALAQQIFQRIESRLPGRIRHLTVVTTDNAVILAGQCSTFYSKQLAQHAAMGVLDYEQLINNIDVRITKAK